MTERRGLLAAIKDTTHELPAVHMAFVPDSEFEALAITRYTDARQVLGDQRFRVGIAFDPEQPRALANQSGFPLNYNGSEHARLRRMLTSAFTVKRVQQLRPQIEHIATAQLDELAESGHEILLEGRGGTQEATDGMTGFRAYVAGIITARRADAGDSLLGNLMPEHGHEVTDDEGTTNTTVEKLLRMLSITSPLMREVTEDIAVGTHHVRAGQRVVVSPPATNWDPQLICVASELDV